MEAFLQKIAESVTKENLPYLYDSCYIFPTKRAAIYFTNFLQQKFTGENFILPETITIQEFITQYSSFIIKDDWHLLLQVYQIQNELTATHQPLEKFLPWGKMILKDLDECDKYLVNVNQLFSLLKAQKEIDDSFYISEETRKYIEQFILTTTTRDNNKENIYKTEFIKTWSLLGDIYTVLHERLKKENFAYEGMAYREVYENLKSEKLKLPYQKISFCGFNALSVCEEKIFQLVEKTYPTEFWWDADAHFMENKLHEAGNFLRDYQQKFSGENSHWIMESSLNHDKNIDIIGISSNVAQAEYVADNLAPKENETTAIVLCDEHLLQPLLFSIDASHANITMGYTVSESELYLFTNLLFKLYGNARMENSKIEYYHKDIAALAKHAFLKNNVLEKQKLENILPYFVPYMPQEILAEFFPAAILENVSTSQQILNVVINIILSLKNYDPYFEPVKESIVSQLTLLLGSLQANQLEVNRNALPFIVKQFLATLKIPFETNTKSNIQIMGFLETRILDFDNLFILSLNDDNLPGTNKTNSFIPYNLRKGFGLPTFEQFDGINAYHFYRLLKRAKNIHLIYNNQISDNASEKSRFIRQIQHDLDTEKNNISDCIAMIEEKNISATSEGSVLRIKKTPEMIALLQQRVFSPSSLKIYIKCPLQFYLRYVAGIKEPEELAEEIDAAVFGQILHKVLELVYHPFLNKLINAEMIKSFSAEYFIREKIKQACIDLELPKEIIQGSNKLQLKIIERIAQKIIQNDALMGDLFILKTEEKFVWNNLQLENGSFASIQGTFDRIDKINEHAVRIIDYKTGQIEIPKFPNIADGEDPQPFLDSMFIFKQKDYSAIFQGILYALMYYKLHDCGEIYVGYHHAKKMKEGISYLNDAQPIPVELLLSFEKRLSQLVSEIIYNDEFIQTNNEDAYVYSPYADLLGIQ
ncbi:MAG: hypothetical protein JWN78_1343 [Bacteroidota bacterium]|nr:hypothetical protein [Bacteroidota bacterium]